MTESKTYLFHELSSYLPLLEGEEFDALVEDIKQFGQIELAILYEGKILDGRNRYRACKQLGIELKVREWKPSEATGITPLQFVISENIVRRHLNTAQRSEIGLLLLEEEERLAKERQSEIGKLTGQMKGLNDEKGKDKILHISKKVEDIKKEMGEGRATEIVGGKVKISRATLQQAKKIKETAKEDKEIAEDWEKAKKGDIGVTTVYEKVKEKEFVKSLEEAEPEVKKAIEEKVITPKEAKEVITLPKELKEAVIKPKAKLTVKEAKEVAEMPKEVQKGVVEKEITVEQAKEISEFPKPEQREAIIKQMKQTKQAEKKIIDKTKEIIEGKKPAPIKVIDIDKKFIDAWKNTKLIDIPIKIKKKFLESYSEGTRQECYRIIKSVMDYLIKEFSEGVKIIE